MSEMSGNISEKKVLNSKNSIIHVEKKDISIVKLFLKPTDTDPKGSPGPVENVNF